MRRDSVGALLLVLACCLPAVSQAAQTANADAQQSAEAWLVLTDGGNYEESWETAGSYFKGQLTREYWEQALQGTRTPLGALESRTLKSATAASSLPGTPDGEYVVMEFDTSFEHKESGVETVTAVKETDGVWRIVGYFIR